MASGKSAGWFEFAKVTITPEMLEKNRPAVDWTIDELQKDLSTTPRNNIHCLMYGIVTSSGEGRVTLDSKSGGFNDMQVELALRLLRNNMWHAMRKCPEWLPSLPPYRRFILWLVMKLPW